MGISGLLPLLKPIQVNRHLSEYSGQTIAVDAYVWLHRGAYACAAELVTGKITNKYVDYAMHRVRLLRHHNITPYLVFDGGPLPAKKGTESERNKKRGENLARAKALSAQGKHSQAREYYVKCVDVTPQMAYQLIKALKAENVEYVVAPYEADAQLAYLEQVGLVDGILTEDSDLLVFGCKNVLLKLDVVESRVTSISRSDFASLASTSAGSISLLGWSDVQFRSMAILSGCDYLPSIPGVGLKTAWSLLKRHKTAENAVRALRLEGKKDVPKGYLEAFKLAEKVFLHQRVYDPLQQRLVYLNAIPDDGWDEEVEAHVGGDIEPFLAKKVAEGDACPITLLPMKDINPSFVPHVLKLKSLNGTESVKVDAKAKRNGGPSGPRKPNGANILAFFTPKPKVQDKPTCSSTPVVARNTSEPAASVGRSSGKRTLTELMDQDMSVKRKRREEREPRNVSIQRAQHGTSSKYFACASSSTPKDIHVYDLEDDSDTEPVAGPSGLDRLRHNKENVPCRDNAIEIPDDSGEISLEEEEPDHVTQEDGYMSPSPSIRGWDSPELSSPVRPSAGPSKPSRRSDSDDFDADILSSPSSVGRRMKRVARESTPSLSSSAGRVLVQGTPTPSKKRKAVHRQYAKGPDLRDMFEDWDQLTSEIDEDCEESMESTPSSGGPVTPESSGRLPDVCADDPSTEVILDDEEIEEQRIVARGAKVANGWWEKWACGSAATTVTASKKFGALRRTETTLTSEGRHRPYGGQPSKTKHMDEFEDPRTARRKGMQRMDETKTGGFFEDGTLQRPEGVLATERVDEAAVSARARLAQFRYRTA